MPGRIVVCEGHSVRIYNVERHRIEKSLIRSSESSEKNRSTRPRLRSPQNPSSADFTNINTRLRVTVRIEEVIYY